MGKMLTNGTQNIAWINTLKVWCMVMIYLNHSEIYCGTTIGVFRNIYLPLFVPSFFFVSGYLLFMKQLSKPLVSLNICDWLQNRPGGGKELLLNIVYKIAIPSILFSTLIYLPKKILRGQVFECSSFLIETIGGCSMWFTSALFIAELIIIILLMTRIKSIWFYLGFGIITGILGHMAFDRLISIWGFPNFPWFWKSSLAAVLYFPHADC